ncbi:MAG: hypothetical protein ACFE94_00545 [Candidatus Hodarchaeota archaeon]
MSFINKKRIVVNLIIWASCTSILGFFGIFFGFDIILLCIILMLCGMSVPFIIAISLRNF